MKIYADVMVTAEENQVMANCPEGVEMHVIEHASKRFYIIFDSDPEPAIYHELQAVVSDNYGQ